MADEQQQQPQEASVVQFSDDVLSDAFNADSTDMSVVMDSLMADAKQQTDAPAEATQQEKPAEVQAEPDSKEAQPNDAQSQQSMLALMEEFLAGNEQAQAQPATQVAPEPQKQQEMPELRVPALEPFKLTDEDAESLGIQDVPKFEQIMNSVIERTASASVENFLKSATPFVFEKMMAMFPAMSASAQFMNDSPEYAQFPRIVSAAISKVQRENPTLQNPYEIVKKAKEYIGGHMAKAGVIAKQIDATSNKPQFSPQGTRPRASVERNTQEKLAGIESSMRNMASVIPSNEFDINF